MIRIIIVDDHFMIREGLTAVLDPYNALHVVAGATDGVLSAIQKGYIKMPE